MTHCPLNRPTLAGSGVYNGWIKCQDPPRFFTFPLPPLFNRTTNFGMVQSSPPMTKIKVRSKMISFFFTLYSDIWCSHCTVSFTNINVLCKFRGLRGLFSYVHGYYVYLV